jgi:excisionase family DNA binding protein
MQDILTTEQAAGILQFSPAYIRTLASKGELPAIQMGDDWRFVKDQLITYISDMAIKQQQSRRFQQTQLGPAEKLIPVKRGRPVKALAK